jgi:hypothetical protein
MTAEMKQAWKEYKRECKNNNICPTPADFLGIELTWEEIDDGGFDDWNYLLCLETSKVPKAFAANA